MYNLFLHVQFDSDQSVKPSLIKGTEKTLDPSQTYSNFSKETLIPT